MKSRKIAGILSESRFEGNDLAFALLGMGINVNFPSSLVREVNNQSTTVLTETGRQADMNALAAATLKESEDLCDLAVSDQADSILELLRDADYSRGETKRSTPERFQLTLRKLMYGWREHHSKLSFMHQTRNSQRLLRSLAHVR